MVTWLIVAGSIAFVLVGVLVVEAILHARRVRRHHNVVSSDHLNVVVLRNTFLPADRMGSTFVRPEPHQLSGRQPYDQDDESETG